MPSAQSPPLYGPPFRSAVQRSRSTAASSAWVPADSQMMTGTSPRSAIRCMSGSGSGPNPPFSAKVRCRFSPPLLNSMREK